MSVRQVTAGVAIVGSIGAVVFYGWARYQRKLDNERRLQRLSLVREPLAFLTSKPTVADLDPSALARSLQTLLTLIPDDAVTALGVAHLRALAECLTLEFPNNQFRPFQLAICNLLGAFGQAGGSRADLVSANVHKKLLVAMSRAHAQGDKSFYSDTLNALVAAAHFGPFPRKQKPVIALVWTPKDGAVSKALASLPAFHKLLRLVPTADPISRSRVLRLMCITTRFDAGAKALAKGVDGRPGFEVVAPYISSSDVGEIARETTTYALQLLTNMAQVNASARDFVLSNPDVLESLFRSLAQGAHGRVAYLLLVAIGTDGTGSKATLRRLEQFSANGPVSDRLMGGLMTCRLMRMPTEDPQQEDIDRLFDVLSNAPPTKATATRILTGASVMLSQRRQEEKERLSEARAKAAVQGSMRRRPTAAMNGCHMHGDL